MNRLLLDSVVDKIINGRINDIAQQTDGVALSVDDAYVIQKEVTSKLGEVIGWKLGGTNEKTKQAFKNEELYFGPIFKNSLISHKGSKINLADLHKPLKGEVEIAFTLSNKIAELDAGYESHRLFDYVDFVHICLEMPWTQFEQPTSGLEWLIADLCGCNALLLGQGKECKGLDLNDVGININMTSGEDEIASGSRFNILGSPEIVLKEFFDLALKYKLDLKPGQVVATGGATACVPIPDGKIISLDATELDPLQFSFNEKSNIVIL